MKNLRRQPTAHPIPHIDVNEQVSGGLLQILGREIRLKRTDSLHNCFWVFGLLPEFVVGPNEPAHRHLVIAEQQEGLKAGR